MLFSTLRFFVKDIFLSVSFGAAILVNLGLWIFLTSVMPAPSSQAFLHYTVYFGIDRVGPWYMMFILPLFGMTIGAGNNVLAAIAYKQRPLLAYFLASATFLVQVIFFIEALLLWRLNG